MSTPTIRLRVSCRDRPGIVAAVSGFLYGRGANIVHADQHSTEERFFMRLVATLAEGDTPDAVGREFEPLAAEYEMERQLSVPDTRKRVALLVSRHEHCLLDLLWRFEQGELEGEPSLVISNHRDLGPRTEAHGVAYHHVPVSAEGKPEAEAELLELLRGSHLVVLARYMQILSRDFLDRLGAPAINIHHSFLPAFAGADPYQRALDRGVKIIGATAHYVTEELDGGPIIEQDVARVTHRDTVGDLQRIGRDIERVVLARATKWHLEDRILVDGGRTVVF
jgi:formyltetrahydrofolate deformylase